MTDIQTVKCTDRQTGQAGREGAGSPKLSTCLCVCCSLAQCSRPYVNYKLYTNTSVPGDKYTSKELKRRLYRPRPANKTEADQLCHMAITSQFCWDVLLIPSKNKCYPVLAIIRLRQRNADGAEHGLYRTGLWWMLLHAQHLDTSWGPQQGGHGGGAAETAAVCSSWDGTAAEPTTLQLAVPAWTIFQFSSFLGNLSNFIVFL